MTYLQIVNAVLRRLRETEVSSISENDYSALIGDFVNEIKREVEESWNWTQLRSAINISTSNATASQAITGAGERYRILNVYNTTEDEQLRQVSQDYIDRNTNVSTIQYESPIYYNIRGASSGDPVVYFWPVPNGVYTIQFNMVIPQNDLSDPTDTLAVPSWPVILGAYARAVSERGEDNGTMFAEAIASYNKALADAISLDAVHQSEELVWDVR